MSDVNRDPIRWERSMTQDKDGQYVSYHDYVVLLEAHDALRAELAALQAQVEAERQEPVRFVRDNVGGAIRGYDLRTGESCGLIPVPCAERSPVADRAAVPDEWIAAAESVLRSTYIKQQHPKRWATFKRLLAAAQESKHPCLPIEPTSGWENL